MANKCNELSESTALSFEYSAVGSVVDWQWAGFERLISVDEHI